MIDLELANYDVKRFSGVDSVAAVIESKESLRTDLFILDIMMPAGELLQEEPTDEGLLTGLFLAQYIRRSYPGVPIILLSHATFESVKVRAQRFAGTLDNCIFIEKRATTSEELVNIVNLYFQELILAPGKRRTALRRWYESLMLQPNFYGLGLDLKKLRDEE